MSLQWELRSENFSLRRPLVVLKHSWTLQGKIFHVEIPYILHISLIFTWHQLTWKIFIMKISKIFHYGIVKFLLWRWACIENFAVRRSLMVLKHLWTSQGIFFMPKLYTCCIKHSMSLHIKLILSTGSSKLYLIVGNNIKVLCLTALLAFQFQAL